jgi:hypothetical protein
MCNVLEHLSLGELANILKLCISVMISTDVLNKNAEKLFPIIDQYFLPHDGVHTKLT